MNHGIVIIFFPAKRPRTSSSSITEDGDAEVNKDSVFYKAVTEAGLKLASKTKQDELGN